MRFDPRRALGARPCAVLTPERKPSASSLADVGRAA